MMRWLGAMAVFVAAVGGAGCDDGAEAAEAPAVKRAADFRSEGVDEALDAAGRVVRTRGFARDGEPWRGFLVHQDSEVNDASMRAGTCYVVAGAASSALRELDLRVFDSDGAEVAQDALTGGRAALEYCPAQSGTYYVAARAVAGSGLFGVRRFQGPSGLDVRVDDLFRATETEPQTPRPERP